MKAGIQSKIILGRKLPVTLSRQVLSFNVADFTNASPRHLFAKNPSSGLYEMTGPFDGGTLATRVIDGKRFAQLESAKDTENTYSEIYRAAISSWIQTRSSVTDNATHDPLGNLTADKLVEDSTPTSTHWMNQTTAAALDGSSRYYVTFFVKADERFRFRIILSGGWTTSWGYYRLDTAETHGTGTLDDSGIIPLDNDWYLCYAAETSSSVATGNVLFYLCDATGSDNYSGDGSSGLFVWGTNVVKAEHLTSYIQAVATPESRAKDQLSWSAANVPAWTRTGLKARLIMHQGTDEMLAAGTQEPTLFAFDTTAKGEVKVYFDHADKKLKWSDSTGALGESVALDWSLSDTVDVSWNPDNGINSTLKVNGGGVNATYTGTQTAVVDGTLYYGMDTSKAKHANIFIISEPEPL